MTKPFFYFILLLICILTGCSQTKKGFRVAATPTPHAELLEFIKPDLKSQDIDLEIVVIDDYNIPNRALADREIDANFFQHIPFLEEQIKQFHYPIMNAAAVEIEPMGIYSEKITSLSELKKGAKIAIPNDPSNEARALLLLQDQGLIQLDDSSNTQATILNIIQNPKKLSFLEIDAAMIPRSLPDVDAAAINTNYALSVHLNPEKDALALENQSSPYVNIIAIRKEDETKPEILALVKAMTSEKMKEFILKKYKGAILPAF